MAAPDVVLLNASKFVNVDQPDWYIQQIMDDDALIMNALKERGISSKRVGWDDSTFDFSAPRLILIRSVWDYFERFEEFSTWLDSVEPHTPIVNALETIRWNIDKHYLADLKKRGIHIPPTHFIKAGSNHSLAELHEQTGWAETVIKPTISGGGFHTYRLNPNNYHEYEAVFAEVSATHDMMLQPFMHFVVQTGEYSLMCFNGRYSFAVQKIAKEGDFRVQDDWGGTVHDYQPTAEEIAFAEMAARAVQPLPLYARVDIIRDNDGKLAIAELELIEPELWIRKHPPAAQLIADALAERLT